MQPSRADRKPQLGLIFLTVFIDLVGFGIVIPILPLYARAFGASETVNGLLVGIYSAVQFFAAPLLGKLSDRVGRRPVLLISLCGTALGFALMGVAPMLAGALVWLFIARIIDGFSGGNISTAQAYIADVTAPEERSRAMGLVGAAFGLGFIFGPAIGGLLSHFSVSAPFYFAAALAAVNAFLVWKRLPESLPPEHRTARHETVPLREVVRHAKGLPVLLACYFLAITGFSIMTTNYALFTHVRFGYDQKANGYLFAFIGLIGAVVQGGMLRHLLKRASERGLAITGVAVMMMGLLLLPLSQTLGILLLASTIIGLGNSLLTPTLNGLASRHTDRQWQGRVIGIMQSAGSLGRWVGPFAAGRLLAFDVGSAAYGRTPFWAAAGIMAVALWLGFLLPRASAAAVAQPD
jgi:MFS transporter, DHA1 family, tetracycline resistance protein